MRKKIKEQLLEILDSMLEIHRQCCMVGAEQLAELMQDCQQAAIAVGETLEAELPDEPEMVSMLEQYCEAAFLLAQEECADCKKIAVLDRLAEQVKIDLEKAKEVYQVVFFPYKAEMWDSLESIWRACVADERCQALVVPIPYFRFDAAAKKAVPCYDGNLFPADVPVISWQEYSIENERPEVVYVHNPYDNANFVTSVHPSFYSSELKKYADKLVYVPYYVTTGYISEEHLQLPVYRNMDYMVAQSEYFKSGCKGMLYYDKVLPFGSPKLDKVIRLCRKTPNIPEDWQKLWQGKKHLMLNTSLNCLLQQGKVYLQKLQALFQWAKKQKSILIVWRPHPLLESTLRSMRPGLLEEYGRLIEMFVKEEVGIFDRTPDITTTVALVDGYIGEEGTSVVNLFGVAGKPIFILNNSITAFFAFNRRKRIRIADMCFSQGKWWMISCLYNGLFSMKEDWSQLQYEGRLANQPKWYGVTSFLTEKEGALYLSPGAASDAASCDGKQEASESRTLEFLGIENKEKEFLHCRQMVVYGDKVFYLPGRNGKIREYDSQTGKWIVHTEAVEAFKRGIPRERYQLFTDTYAYACVDSKLWITAAYTNRLLCFDMETAAYKIWEAGQADFGYSGIAVSGQELWLAETGSGVLVVFNFLTGETRSYKMPEEFRVREQASGLKLAHMALFDMGRFVVTVPAFSDAMVKADKETGEVVICAGELFTSSEVPANEYHPLLHSSCCFAKKISEKELWIQRTCDDAVILLNVETEKYETKVPELSETAWKNLTEGEDGFERPRGDFFAFARRESRIFTLDAFVDDLLHGRLEQVKERQYQELSSFAANLDGTCGEKVHTYLMEKIG